MALYHFEVHPLPKACCTHALSTDPQECPSWGVENPTVDSPSPAHCPNRGQSDVCESLPRYEDSSLPLIWWSTSIYLMPWTPYRVVINQLWPDGIFSHHLLWETNNQTLLLLNFHLAIFMKKCFLVSVLNLIPISFITGVLQFYNEESNRGNGGEIVGLPNNPGGA